MVDRTPNHRLQDVIDEANISAKALARMVRDLAVAQGASVACNHASVSRWLAGMRPRDDTAELLRQALSLRTGRSLRLADLGLEPDAAVDAATGLSYGDTPDQATTALAGLWQADLNGVPAVTAASVSGGAWTEASLAWLVRRPGRDGVASRGEGRRVGLADVEAIRVTAESFAAIDNRFGGRHGRHALVQYLRTELAPLLAADCSGSVRRQLYGAASEATLLGAWMSYDAGSHGLAQRYFIQALRLAEAADDVLLAGSILDAMSHQATFLGRYREAANLARAARTGTRGHATPLLEAHFAVMEARAQAGAGDRAGAERALAEAACLFERARPDDGPAWMAYFDEAELAAEFAHSYRDLGHPSGAVQYAEQALAGAGASQRSDFFVSMVLAAGHLAAGDLEQACATAQGAIELGGAVKSARAIEYVRQFRHGLAQYGTAAAVANLAATAGMHSLWLAAD